MSLLVLKNKIFMVMQFTLFLNYNPADVHHVVGEVDKKGNSPKLRFVGGKQRLDDDQSQCTEDIARLCPEIPKGNNFALLVCLQDKAKVHA